jgi:hypothetical protein
MGSRSFSSSATASSSSSTARVGPQDMRAACDRGAEGWQYNLDSTKIELCGASAIRFAPAPRPARRGARVSGGRSVVEGSQRFANLVMSGRTKLYEYTINPLDAERSKIRIR